MCVCVCACLSVRPRGSLSSSAKRVDRQTDRLHEVFALYMFDKTELSWAFGAILVPQYNSLGPPHLSLQRLAENPLSKTDTLLLSSSATLDFQISKTSKFLSEILKIFMRKLQDFISKPAAPQNLDINKVVKCQEVKNFYRVTNKLLRQSFHCSFFVSF